MSRSLTMASILACAVLLSGCNKGAVRSKEGGQAPSGAARVPPGSLVEVPVAGKEFSPPVKPDQLPRGAWYCEMGGTVHWAQPEEGDRQCPLCRMELKHKQ